MRRERQSQSILKIVKGEVSEEQEILYCEKTLLNILVKNTYDRIII